MKIDCHMHVNGGPRTWGWEDNEAIIDTADRLGIDQLCCSIPITRGMPTPEECRVCNDGVLAAMERYPGRILGYCFVNPGYHREAIEEIKRCIDGHGMIGVKLYNQYLASDPAVFPVVEQTIEMGVPILHHAGHPTDPASRAAQPHISDGVHFAQLAAQYPEALIIEGHIGGGGDWEWSIKAVRNAPNVYLDTSGSVVDNGIIEFAVEVLGTERLLFGTDMTMEGGVGKILGAELTEDQREMIFYRNMKDILDRRERP